MAQRKIARCYRLRMNPLLNPFEEMDRPGGQMRATYLKRSLRARFLRARINLFALVARREMLRFLLTPVVDFSQMVMRKK